MEEGCVCLFNHIRNLSTRGTWHRAGPSPSNKVIGLRKVLVPDLHVQRGTVTIVHPQLKPLLPLWVEGLWTNLRMCVVCICGRQTSPVP